MGASSEEIRAERISVMGGVSLPCSSARISASFSGKET